MLTGWRAAVWHCRLAQKAPLRKGANLLRELNLLKAPRFVSTATETTASSTGKPPVQILKDVALPWDQRPKMVILGTGWATVNVIHGLDKRALQTYNILVCSPTNHFVNTPLLPSVTVGTLGPRTVAEPIRNSIVAHRKRNPDAWIKFNEVEARTIDHEKKRILVHTRGVEGRGDNDTGGQVPTSRTVIQGMLSATVETEYWIDYDVLVCAVGATTNTFGTPGALQYCTFLKTIQDAMKIRTTLLDCFETAAVFGTPDVEIDRLLSFVIVGAGPTGVEIAAELRDFAKEDVLPRYSGFKDREIKITIVEMTDRMLGTYDKIIQKTCQERFKKLDIEMLTEHQVKKVNRQSVEVLDLKTNERKELKFGMCVWASGVRPNSVSLELAKNLQGTRILEVDGNMRVRGAEGSIYALGDCAKITYPSMKESAKALFEKADVNKDGVLSKQEFQSMIQEARKDFPQLETYLHQASVLAMHEKVDGIQPTTLGITPEVWENACAMVDKELKMLPPTAQVAAQQGDYLAKILNEVPYQDLGHQSGYEPHFEYRHMGSMAYIGGEHAVMDSPVTGISSGLITYIMWKGVYFGKSVSFTMRVGLLFDWAKSWFLGRDTSRL